MPVLDRLVVSNLLSPLTGATLQGQSLNPYYMYSHALHVLTCTTCTYMHYMYSHALHVLTSSIRFYKVSRLSMPRGMDQTQA